MFLYEMVFGKSILDLKVCWVVFFIFIQILIEHSVSKQWKPWSADTTFCGFSMPTKRMLGLFHCLIFFCFSQKIFYRSQKHALKLKLMPFLKNLCLLSCDWLAQNTTYPKYYIYIEIYSNFRHFFFIFNVFLTNQWKKIYLPSHLEN